jgi:hypothetical protein
MIDKVTLNVPGWSEPVVITPPREDYFKKPVYGVESVDLGLESFDCDVKYSMEKFFGNKKDKEAPGAGQMRIQMLGFGIGVVFEDGSKAKNDINAIFTSPYVKQKIKEFNDYYIGQKGYQPFTQEDASKLKTDVAQILRKFFSYNLFTKVQIKFFDGAAIYGMFSHFIGKELDRIVGSDNGSDGGPKALLGAVKLNRIIPYCIVYTHTNEKGEKRVFVKRFLVSGIYSKNINKITSHAGSGGKDIGTVK